jgi:hypothetical protein
MTFSNAACCAEVLKQQQLEAIEHCTECDQPAFKPLPAIPKTCTVVENGRVVVRKKPA